MEESKSVKIPCERYSRVCGFYRPVSQWNGGKKSEFWDRKVFKLPSFLDNSEYTTHASDESTEPGL